jgi:DNA-binding beta-propeller fold protein YncE
MGIARTSDGALIVAEAGEGRVLKISIAGKVSVLAGGLGRPTGVAVAADGSCYASETSKGRVVKVDDGTTTVVEGLRLPHGLAFVGGQLLILNVGSKELISFSPATKQRQLLAASLPVGAPPGIVPKPLMGVPDLIPGPLPPFAGLAVGTDGTIYLAGDGEGDVLALKRTA